MRRLLLLICLGMFSCRAYVMGLEPRPNIPPLRSAPSINIVLDDQIKQRTLVDDALKLETFRGDLKAGFYNGYPGATKDPAASLTLRLENVEPTLTCFGNVACYVKLRFRGTIEGAEAVGFAGDVKSDVCQGELAICATGAIERLYEQLHGQVEGKLPAPRAAAQRNDVSEL